MATDWESGAALELEDLAAMCANMRPGEDHSDFIRVWVLARKHRGLPTGPGDWNAALKARRDEEGADD